MEKLEGVEGALVASASPRGTGTMVMVDLERLTAVHSQNCQPSDSSWT